MNASDTRWERLAGSKEYRAQYVSAQAKRAIPFQIRTLMRQLDLTQERLAELSGLSQGVVSRAADPDYGNLTLNTIIRIAAGFDVGFVGQFVSFSKFDRWFAELDEDARQVKTFTEEEAELRKAGDQAGSIDNAPNAAACSLQPCLQGDPEQLGTATRQNAGGLPNLASAPIGRGIVSIDSSRSFSANQESLVSKRKPLGNAGALAAMRGAL